MKIPKGVFRFPDWRLARAGVFPALVASTGLWLSGCRTPGVLLSEETSTTCPTCKSETRSLPFAGLDYSTHTCPKCHARWAPDEHYDEPEYVHVCEKCKTILEMCPVCREQ